MRLVYNTFLKYIAENCAVSVHPVRKDPGNPDSEVLQLNSVNISFLDYMPNQGNGQTRFVLDLCYESENAAIAAMTSVLAALLAYQTQVVDYTVPTSPVSIQSYLYWDRTSVRFMRVLNPNYVHYSCTLTVQHV